MLLIDQEVHRDTQPKRTGTVEMGILIPTYARTPSKASEMDESRRSKILAGSDCGHKFSSCRPK